MLRFEMRDTPRVSEKSGDARAIRVGIIGRHLCVLFLSDRQLLHVVEVPTEAFEKLVAGGARANGKVEITPRARARIHYEDYILPGMQQVVEFRVIVLCIICIIESTF